MKTLRITSLAVAIAFSASTAHAQALATFSSAELAGYGEGSLLLGASLTSGNQGWGPIGTLIGQTYRFRDQGIGSSSHAQAWAISPAAGMQYSTSTGAVQGLVGYTFVNSDEGTNNLGVGTVVAGNPTGGTNSAFVSAQVNHWGTGEHGVQWIGNYAFESEYYWTRLRLNQRFITAPHPVYFGVEGVVQGSQKTESITVGTSTFRTQAQTRYQVGPTIEYRVTNDLRIGGAVGYRGGNNGFPGSGYAKLEMLALSRW